MPAASAGDNNRPRTDISNEDFVKAQRIAKSPCLSPKRSDPEAGIFASRVQVALSPVLSAHPRTLALSFQAQGPFSGSVLVPTNDASAANPLAQRAGELSLGDSTRKR